MTLLPTIGPIYQVASVWLADYFSKTGPVHRGKDTYFAAHQCADFESG